MSTPHPFEDAVSRLTEKLDPEVEDETPQEEDTTESDLDVEDVIEPEAGEPAGEEDEETEEEDGPEEEEPEEAESSYESWESLDEVLEAGQIDPESLPVEVTVAGQKKKVTLKEALNGYQRQADYDRNVSSLKESNKAIQQERETLQKRYNELNEVFALADGYWNAEKEMLKQRRDSIDWRKLRDDNPTEYAAALADFDREERLIDEQQGTIRKKFEEVKEQALKEAQQANEQRAQVEGRKLLEAVPEWHNNRELFEQETTQLGNFLQSSGYTQQELQQFVDHRALILARKAMLYDAAQASATQIVGNSKKPKSKPKPKRLLRPGARPASVAKRKNVKRDAELRKAAKKTGREDIAIERLKSKFGD